MKKTVITVVSVLLGMILVYFIVTGMSRRTDVYIYDFEVKDGEMTVHTGVAGSVGYARSVSCRQSGKALDLTFYSAFGGINGSVGAKNQFTIELNDETEEIRIFRGGDKYETELIKTGAGWEKYKE